MFTSALGLLAVALVTAAMAMAPADVGAGTVCSCPSGWTWRTANGSAVSYTACPQSACLADAQANAAAVCGADGICSFGSSQVWCAIIADGPHGTEYRASCTLQYVCNICIDYQD